MTDTPASAENGPGSHGTPGGPSGKCVLVIEDERHTRLALQRFLQRHGWQTIGFGTAADATAWLAHPELPPAANLAGGAGESSAESPTTLAGAVIDIHLPDGDGIELTGAVRQRLGRDLPIVIVSGDTSMETLRRLRDAGADRFVGKPMNLAALREALQDRPAANP